MSSTKILKVLKDDKFGDLLNEFRNTSAEEVIFVLPKNGKAFKNEAHFAALQEESRISGRVASFLCSNPEIAATAKQYNFSVLSTEEKPKAKTVAVTTEPEDEENPDFIQKEWEDKEPEAHIGFHEESDGKEGALKEDEEPYEEPAEEKNEENGENEENEEEEEEGEEAPTKEEAELPVANEPDFEIVAAAARKPATKITGHGTKIPVKMPGKKMPEPEQTDNIWQETAEESGEDFWSKLARGRTVAPQKHKAAIRRQPKSLSQKAIVWGSVSAVVTIGTIIYLTVGSAKVIIRPQDQKLDFQLKVTASDKFASVDTAFNKIPGQLFTIEKSASDTFTSSGEKEVAQKSKGKITVYNEYGSSPQILIATTRFQSVEGLIFRTLKTISVPGARVENGKTIAGAIDVEVIADKAGQVYNVAPGKFTIPAFKEKGDADRYGKIYGQSTVAMRGGAIGKAKVVTESDYQNGKQLLLQKVKEAAEKDLKDKTAGFKIIDGASISYDFDSGGIGVDDAAESFTLTITETIKNIGFSEKDLLGLISQYVNKTSDLVTLPEKLEISYGGISFNTAENSLQFTVSVKGKAYAKVEKVKIVSDLQNKKEGEIRDYFKDASGIAEARVILSPFWVRKVPQNPAKIKLELVYD